ncbi:minor tail protein L [Colwellia phage 9A]|uniref:Minor tail protein L n=1 Tax=Colwellia phage 9A TaxID=765765 RepID=I3UMD7_9CAUD|nr:minor tail protein L [Colwellia phage 9A]AFK66652.1 minor tail protein L [Colwellia phage 9A]
MTLLAHRQKENVGGVVHLLTIDMSGVTGDPTHIRRFTNGYGADGTGVLYQGNQFLPQPYELKRVRKSQKANKSGAKILISDNEDFLITRFIDQVGGNIQNARVFETKVFGKYLDLGESPNPLAYVKRLDHLVSYVEDSDRVGEIIIHTIDPLSRDIQVPTISFSAGVPNSGQKAINIFPAVDRNIKK